MAAGTKALAGRSGRPAAAELRALANVRRSFAAFWRKHWTVTRNDRLLESLGRCQHHVRWRGVSDGDTFD